MFSVPCAAEPLSSAIREVFTRPTSKRFLALMTGLIVTMGRRTVSHVLAVIVTLIDGHWSNYHRLYSSAKFSMWALAAVVVRQVVALLPSDVVIELAADDTVDGKEGDHVWAKGSHRDSVRSSKARTHIKFGHKWLVLCVLIRLKGWDRPWALPILCGLCVSPRVAGGAGVRPKTSSQLARQLLIRLMRWLPDRRFVLVGDSLIITHETVKFAQRHSDRVVVIGRLRGDANLYAPPQNPLRKSRGGELAKKGRKAPSPATRAGQLAAKKRTIDWYGGSRRCVRYVDEAALWYDKHGRGGVTAIHWVCVLGDQTTGLKDAFFFSSDAAMEGATIIEHYAHRWNIEVMFEETRALLGLESTRHWCRQSVLRVMPILLGLFTAIVLIWHELPASAKQQIVSGTPCYPKRHVTFADVLAAVRLELWKTTLLEHGSKTECLTALPPKVRQTLLWHLSAAA